MEVSQLLKVYRKKAVINKVTRIGGTLFVNIPWPDIESYSITLVGIRRVVYRVPGELKPTKTKYNRYIKIPKESGIREGEYVLIYREGNKIIVEA